MSADRLHERDLPGLLAELAPASKPAYRDAIVRQTAAMRQRPAWTFAERWIPMTTYTSRATTPPAWRAAGVALLLVLAIALAAVAALVAGSRHRPTVPPFGPAGNGDVALESSGDILTADPVTGVSKLLVGGAATDTNAVWSRDGSHLAFRRDLSGGGSALFVVAADGTGLLKVSDLASAASQYTFTADGRGLLVVSDGQAFLANADGSPPRPVLRGEVVREAAIRPGGSEIIYVADGAGGPGIYATGIDGDVQRARTIASPTGAVLGSVRPSPDGTRITYWEGEDDPTMNTYRVHIVDADGTNNRILPKPAGARFQDAQGWSNDGTRLAVVRGYGVWNEDMVLAVVPADGQGTGVESAHRITGCCDTIMEWAPDNSWILVLPETSSQSPARQLRLDPATGDTQPMPWVATSPPAVQRVAP